MADLLAYQFDDADDGEATAKSREDRKRRAFLDSKSSYPQEPVVLFPGVSVSLTEPWKPRILGSPAISVVHEIHQQSGGFFCGI